MELVPANRLQQDGFYCPADDLLKIAEESNEVHLSCTPDQYRDMMVLLDDEVARVRDMIDNECIGFHDYFDRINELFKKWDGAADWRRDK